MTTIRMTSRYTDGAFESEETFTDMEALRADLEETAEPEYMEAVMSGLQNADSVTVKNGASLRDTYTIERCA